MARRRNARTHGRPRQPPPPTTIPPPKHVQTEARDVALHEQHAPLQRGGPDRQVRLPARRRQCQFLGRPRGISRARTHTPPPKLPHATGRIRTHTATTMSPPVSIHTHKTHHPNPIVTSTAPCPSNHHPPSQPQPLQSTPTTTNKNRSSTPSAWSSTRSAAPRSSSASTASGAASTTRWVRSASHANPPFFPSPPPPSLCV